jgi:hypothetical protein
MKLSDIHYDDVKKLLDFSTILSGAIKKTGYTITPDQDIQTVNNDILGLWEMSSIDICYGRYLLYEKSMEEQIKFWIGLHSTPNKSDLIIWFKKSEFKYTDITREKFCGPCVASNQEIWVPLDAPFCIDDITECIISDFIKEVLSQL